MGLLKKLGHKLKRLLSLQVKDYRYLVEAWLVLAWVDLVIRFSRYERWRHWLESAEKNSKKHQLTFDIASLITLSEMVARHHVCPMNCLRRTVAQKLMLARRGIICCVHIGVKNEGNGFEAHSWLSYKGKVLNDSADVSERYVELEKDQWRNVKHFH